MLGLVIVAAGVQSPPARPLRGRGEGARACVFQECDRGCEGVASDGEGSPTGAARKPAREGEPDGGGGAKWRYLVVAHEVRLDWAGLQGNSRRELSNEVAADV